jgi:hypothetical protein
MVPPGYQDSDIESRFVITLRMIVKISVSAVVMSIPVMAAAVSVIVPSAISVTIPFTLMLTVPSAATLPKTAGTCGKQDNG